MNPQNQKGPPIDEESAHFFPSGYLARGKASHTTLRAALESHLTLQAWSSTLSPHLSATGLFPPAHLPSHRSLAGVLRLWLLRPRESSSRSECSLRPAAPLSGLACVVVRLVEPRSDGLCLQPGPHARSAAPVLAEAAMIGPGCLILVLESALVGGS